MCELTQTLRRHVNEGAKPSSPFAVSGLSLLLLFAVSLHIGQVGLVQGAGGVVRMHQQLAAVAVQMSVTSRRHVQEYKPAPAELAWESLAHATALAESSRTEATTCWPALACPASHLIDLPPPRA
jgi:hypothetical protein